MVDYKDLLKYLSDDELEMLQYPNNFKISTWRKYLGRKLKASEKELLYDCRLDKKMNDMLDDLYKICKERELYVPQLTEIDGNCLFESLNYHGIGNSVDSLRKGIAHVMWYFRDEQNYFDNNELSIKEIFNYINEIEYVWSKDKKKNVKYTFDVMCMDLTNDCSWTRLPTELILRIVSKLYRVKMVIINSSNKWINEINNCGDDNITIYLGHLGESHYVPIDLGIFNKNSKNLYYEESLEGFHIWAKKMQTYIVKKYIDAILL